MAMWPFEFLSLLYAAGLVQKGYIETGYTIIRKYHLKNTCVTI